MTLGTIGRGVKLNREGTKFKIMCVMEQSRWLLWAIGVNSTGNLGHSREKTSKLFSPCSPPRSQENGEFILQFPSITG